MDFSNDSIADGVCSLLLPPFLPAAVLNSAVKTIPEDAAHRWRRNIEKISQN